MTSGPSVRWRVHGHRLERDTDVLRFEVADLNRDITHAVANAELYRRVQDAAGHPANWQVLVLSCFALTPEWPPARLAEQIGFRSYRVTAARSLADAGYQLWPTEVFVDDIPDPRNEMHPDVVVAGGPELIDPTLTVGDKAARRAARSALAPLFERLLDTLGAPIDLS